MKYSCCQIFLKLWVLVFAGFLLLNKNILRHILLLLLVSMQSQHNSQVVARMKEVLASWTAEFQHEVNFAPIRQLYDSLRKEGISFVQAVFKLYIVKVYFLLKIPLQHY